MVECLVESPFSAHRLLQERANLSFGVIGQFFQRKSSRPHVSFVEIRFIGKTKGRVSCLELLRVLEKANNISVLGVRRHAVPGFRQEYGCVSFNNGMETARPWHDLMAASWQCSRARQPPRPLFSNAKL